MAHETSPSLRDPSRELAEPVAPPSDLLEWIENEVAKGEARQFYLYWLPIVTKRRGRTAKTVNVVLLPSDDSVVCSALEVANLYGVRAAQDPRGKWVVLGFELEDEESNFPGRISDPVPLASVMPPDGDRRNRGRL